MPGETSALVLVAHADDTEFFAGGFVASLAHQGIQVTEVIATNNERGSYELEGEELIEASRAEALEAGRIMGKKEVLFLDYSDGLLSDTPLNELREKFMRQIRKIRPRIVLSFDPWAPFDPHPDHRVVAMAAQEATAFAQNPRFHPEHMEQGLSPHQVAEVYLFAKNPQNANRTIDVTDFMETKIDALLAHDSQMKLTIDDLKLGVKAVGKHMDVLPMLDRDNPRPLLEMMIRTWNREQAEGEDFEYGEKFLYQSADSILDGRL